MQSPPLHHPVPQHQINLHVADPNYGYPPDARAAGSSIPQGYPYASSSSHIPPPGVHPAQAQNPAFNPLNFVGSADLGKHAFDYGQRYLSESLSSYGVSMSWLRYYFRVTNGYVLKKLGLILFPWRHKPWNRQLQPVQGTVGQEAYAYPSEDINAPDMYIPVMAFITHLVAIALAQGLEDQFHPEQFGSRASTALALVIVELILLKLFTYLLAASSSSLLDLCAYSGYKFVAMTITTLTGIIANSRAVRWSTFVYTGASTAFFMLRSLKYILLPEYSPSNTASPATTISGSKRQQRIYFLFAYGVVWQLASMLLLS